MDDIQPPQPAEEQEQNAPTPTKKMASKLSPFIALFGTGGIAIFALVIGLAIAFSFIKFREPAPVTYAGGYDGGSLGCSLTDPAFEDTTTMLYGNVADDAGYGLAADEAVKRTGTESNRKDYFQKIIKTGHEVGINPAVLIAFWGAEQSVPDGRFSIVNADKAFSCYIDGDKHLGFQQSMQCALEFTMKPVLGRPYITNTMVDQAKYKSQVSLYSNITTPDKIVHHAGIWDRLLYHYVAAAKKTNYDNFGYTTDESDTRIKILKQLVPDQVVCNNASGGLAIQYYSQGYGFPAPIWASKTTASNGNFIFGSHHSLKDAGCGITSIAMVASYFKGTEITPSKAADDIVGKCGEACGSDFGKYTAGSNSVVSQLYGITISRNSPVKYTSGESFPSKWITDQTNNNKPVIIRVLPGSTLAGHTYAKGHYLVVRGINQSNELMINEPVYPNKKKASIDSLIGSFELYSVSKSS